MNKLRIAYVADTLNGLGGGVAVARSVVDRLRTEHDVTVIGADADGEGAVVLPAFDLPIRAMRRMKFIMARPDRASIAGAMANVDVVHLQFPFWLSFVALSEARKAGRPVVAAFHVQPENALLNVGVRSPALCRLMYRVWVRDLYDKADAVVCPTEFAKRKLVQHGLRSRAVVISNGVPPDIVPRAFAPKADGRFRVMMVGRLAAEKRQEDMIEAVRTCRHRDVISLVIAGAGPREEELKRLASALPNGAEIGFVSRERLRTLLAEADLFVHCSEVELEGISVLEALGAGVPVLVAQSSESAASELATTDDFRFAAGDPRELAAKLDALIEHPALLSSARARSLAIAGGLGFERSIAQLVSLYRFVADESRAHAA
ncbi:MAG: glycosyltransferase [Polyangiaceae bacterium]|jgi:glycosyltransferase involved in cell wall biosynthesis